MIFLFWGFVIAIFLNVFAENITGWPAPRKPAAPAGSLHQEMVANGGLLATCKLMFSVVNPWRNEAEFDAQLEKIQKLQTQTAASLATRAFSEAWPCQK